MATTAPVSVIGRDEELALLGDFVSSLASGPAAFVLVGEAGVGKTTLWRAGADAARERGCRVLETRPSQAEARLAFAGLSDLLGPALVDLLDALPPPQADALRVALLLKRPDGAIPDERAVAIAFLNALRELAADQPTLVSVDDLQWLDSPSAAVLGFAWRRLRDERAGLLASRRAGEPVSLSLTDDDRIHRLDVVPLSLGAVHRLLQEQVGLVLPRPVLRRIYEVAAGNAFYSRARAGAFSWRSAVPRLLRWTRVPARTQPCVPVLYPRPISLCLAASGRQWEAPDRRGGERRIRATTRERAPPAAGAAATSRNAAQFAAQASARRRPRRA